MAYIPFKIIKAIDFSKSFLSEEFNLGKHLLFCLEGGTLFSLALINAHHILRHLHFSPTHHLSSSLTSSYLITTIKNGGFFVIYSNHKEENKDCNVWGPTHSQFIKVSLPSCLETIFNCYRQQSKRLFHTSAFEQVEDRMMSRKIFSCLRACWVAREWDKNLVKGHSHCHLLWGSWKAINLGLFIRS